MDLPELTGLTSARRAGILQGRLGEAADAFARERYPDALRILRPIAEEVPEAAGVRELLGLTYYRLGRWKPAIRELEAFVDLTGGSTEQHPVLADCYRAQGRYGRVEELWDELRAASPGAELVTEGRIVVAGSLADQGRLGEAIAVAEKGWRAPQRPAAHHLRRAYVLADLHERAGDLPRARAGFRWVLDHDPDFADVAERLAGLG